MKLTVLADNNTLIDRYFIGEPAVSYFIESDGKRILYDVGYSDAFIKNARKLYIDLLNLDYLVLSHGHLDHMWGLDPLLRMYAEASIEGMAIRTPQVIAHEKTFHYRPRSYLGGSGSMVDEARVSKYFEIRKIAEPTWLTRHFVALPNIPKANDFEAKKPFKQIRNNGKDEDDYVKDEIALAYKSNDGLIVINPCSHRGICNTIEYAIEVCKVDKIADVVGGFHLQNPDKEVLNSTVSFLAEKSPTAVHAGHCTDLRSKVAIANVTNLQEMGAGLQLTYE